MVTQYGMSEKFGVMGLATVQSQYLDGKAYLNCSDTTAALVDEEVRRILEECYGKAREILSENMDALDLIADYLIRQETISGKEFMKLYRQANIALTRLIDRHEIDLLGIFLFLTAELFMEPFVIMAQAFEILEDPAGKLPESAAPREEVPEKEREEEAPAGEENSSREASDEEGPSKEESAPQGTRGRYSHVPLEDLNLFDE